MAPRMASNTVPLMGWSGARASTQSGRKSWSSSTGNSKSTDWMISRHRPLAQVQAAHRQAGHVVLLRQLGPEGLGPVGVRPGGVEEDEEGLAQLLELGDHPGLRLQVGLPGQVGDGAVGGDHDANGGVLGNDLPGADLRGLRHGDLLRSNQGV